MGKTYKHDYTHRPATPQQLEVIADILKRIEERGGTPTQTELLHIAATLPPGSAILGTAEYSGLIGWKISWTSTTGHRYFSPFLVAAERLLTSLAGTVIFNHAPPKAGDYKPRSRLYPQISYQGHNGSDHVALNRLTMDAQAGQTVTASRDYHDCSPRALAIQEGGRASANRYTAVSRTKSAYEAAQPEQRPFATWEEFEQHIQRAFRLLDSERSRLNNLEPAATAA